MSGDNSQVRLSVSLTESQKAAIAEIAEKSEVSVARVIRQAITEFLASRPDRQLRLFDTRPDLVETRTSEE